MKVCSSFLPYRGTNDGISKEVRNVLRIRIRGTVVAGSNMIGDKDWGNPKFNFDCSCNERMSRERGGEMCWVRLFLYLFVKWSIAYSIIYSNSAIKWQLFEFWNSSLVIAKLFICEMEFERNVSYFTYFFISLSINKPNFVILLLHIIFILSF